MEYTISGFNHRTIELDRNETVVLDLALRNYVEFYEKNGFDSPDCDLYEDYVIAKQMLEALNSPRKLNRKDSFL